MQILSNEGNVILETSEIHFYSEMFPVKSTGAFTFLKQHRKYTCPVRGSVDSFKLVQATNTTPSRRTFNAYYLSYTKNDVAMLQLKNSDFNYFFTDTLDGCSIGISDEVRPEGVITKIYHSNAFNYGEYLYRKEKMNLSFAYKRQIEKQNKMIRVASNGNAKIITPWNYGHTGSDTSFYRTLIFGCRQSCGFWFFFRQTYNIRNIENSWFS